MDLQEPKYRNNQVCVSESSHGNDSKLESPFMVAASLGEHGSVGIRTMYIFSSKTIIMITTSYHVFILLGVTGYGQIEHKQLCIYI